MVVGKMVAIFDWDCKKFAICTTRNKKKFSFILLKMCHYKEFIFGHIS